MNASGEDREFPRRVVEIHTNHSEAARLDRAFTESRHHLIRSIGGDLEIPEAGGQQNLSVAGSAVLTKNANLKGAVGRESCDAPIVKLEFSLAILARTHNGAFEQRRVGERGIGNDLVALAELDITGNKAEAGSPHVGVRLLRRVAFGVLSAECH